MMLTAKAWPKDVRKTMISGVNGGGGAPFQVLPPVLFRSTTTVETTILLRWGGWVDVTPGAGGGGPPLYVTERGESLPSTPHGRPAATGFRLRNFGAVPLSTSKVIRMKKNGTNHTQKACAEENSSHYS